MSEADVRSRTPLFNSQLETGTRAVVVLDAAFPRALDIVRLTWFDHLIVHTADIGGPDSLHPSLPERVGELLVRRRLVEDSLKLMRRLHLVDTVAEADGIAYRASEDTSAFVALMRTRYAVGLKKRAIWLVDELGDIDQAQMAARVSGQIDRWALDFQGDVSAPGATA